MLRGLDWIGISFSMMNLFPLKETISRHKNHQTSRQSFLLWLLFVGSETYRQPCWWCFDYEQSSFHKSYVPFFYHVILLCMVSKSYDWYPWIPRSHSEQLFVRPWGEFSLLYLPVEGTKVGPLDWYPGFTVVVML